MQAGLQIPPNLESMNRFLLLFFLFYLTSCVRREVPLALEAKQNYDQLPARVQDSFRHYDQFSHYLLDGGDVLNLDTLNQYEFQVKTTGPWTDYFLLIDKNRNNEYKIPTGSAFPFVICDGVLYIPNTYNIANSEEAGSTDYKKYRLH